MNRKYVLRFILLLSLFATSFAHAYSNTHVTDWAQSVLIDTFTASYLDTPAEIYAVQKNYSHSAWEPMNNFFHHELKIIKEQKLSLHPRALTQPEIVETGTYMGSDSWRVNQSFNVPELHMSIACSALVISTRSANSSLLIQSVDMTVHRY